MNAPKAHPTAETLTLWSLGDMGPEDSARVASHIAGCADCRIETAKTQATLESLRRDGDHAPSEGQLAAARLAARAAFLHSNRRPTWVLWAASAAAAVLISVVSASLLGGDPAGDAHEVAERPDATVPAHPGQPATEPASKPAAAIPTPSPIEREMVPRGTKLPRPVPPAAVNKGTAHDAAPADPSKTPDAVTPAHPGLVERGDAPTEVPAKAPESGDSGPKTAPAVV